MLKALRYILLSCSLLSFNIWAANADVYTTSVPISSARTANNKEVLTQGMLQVLVKASNNTNIAENSVIKAALDKPESFLLNFSAEVIESSIYVAESDETVISKQLVSVQSFSPKLIDNLVTKADLSINTPSELIKLRINDVVNVDSYIEIEKYLGSLSAVENHKVARVGKDYMELSVSAKNGKKALLQALNLDSKLVEYQQSNSFFASENAVDSGTLEFRWRS